MHAQLSLSFGIAVVLTQFIEKFQERSEIKMVFKGHSGYLHCIVARNSSNQVKFTPFFCYNMCCFHVSSSKNFFPLTVMEFHSFAVHYAYKHLVS